MKFREFKVGDCVLVGMPTGSGFDFPLQEGRVIEKQPHGIVLFEKYDGKRWMASARRIAATLPCLKQE